MLERFMSLIPIIILAGWIAFFILWKKSRRYQQFRTYRRNNMDRLLVSRGGMRFFLVGIVCVIAITILLFLSPPDSSKMPLSNRLLWGIFGIIAPVTILGLFFGMWRYWVKFDDSGKWLKRTSFVLLLVGFWWGSAVYYFIVYLPQFYQRQKLEV